VRELRVEASAPVAATPEACTELLAAIDRYPSWYPRLIRQAEVLERDAGGEPKLARATVHLALGPVVHDLHLVMAVTVEPGKRVTLTRVAHQASDEERFDLAWRVESGSRTALHLELSAYVNVPRFVPVGALGGQLAQGFVDAAKRELEGSSPNTSASSS
jgi:hypothetical protein